jgi:hypothetical protein
MVHHGFIAAFWDAGMRNIFNLLILTVALVIAGCAGMGGPPLVAGDPEAAVRAKMGQPTAVYRDGNEHLLEYAGGPFGQRTVMARIGPDGRLKSIEQVLTGQKFATLKIGTATRDDVLRTLGRPAERSYLALPKLEVWSYRYKESGVWNSMMHVHFDRSGVLRMMQNGPDEEMEREHRPFFR